MHRGYFCVRSKNIAQSEDQNSVLYKILYCDTNCIYIEILLYQIFEIRLPLVTREF